MKKSLLTILFFCSMLTTAWCQIRYKDTLFSDIQKRTFVYADSLKLDFYDVKNDYATAKPLAILVHGGGFVAGQRDGGEEIGLSTALAKKGYAVASISYRLTMKGKSFGCDCPSSIKMKTYVDAVEDVFKAIYYLTTYASDFHIDPHKIILIGSSAGAETILNAIVMKDHYLFKPIVYANAQIIGGISFSGDTIDSDYLTKENAVPMLFFHGALDDKVPYDVASHYYCQPDAKGYLILDGPLKITHRLKELEASFCLYTDPDGGHEWAELGYGFTDIITDFMYEHIVLATKIQKIALISKP